MKVLKIGAIWCSGCLVMGPVWKEIENENAWLNTEYYDFDTSQNIVKKYGLEGGKIPTFIFLDKKNEEIDRISGEISKDKLIKLINEYKNK